MPILNGEHIGEMIFSVFLGMILPFLITGTIFMIIRLFFRKALWNMPVIQLLVDFVLALIFLLVCAVVVWPLVSHWLKTAEIPDGPVFVNEDGTSYEYDASTEWVDICLLYTSTARILVQRVAAALPESSRTWAVI